MERLLPAGQAPNVGTHASGTVALDSTDLGLNPGVTTWGLCDPGQVTALSKPSFPHLRSDNHSNAQFGAVMTTLNELMP